MSKIDPATIDLNDKRVATFGLALALASLSLPAKVDDKDKDTKVYLAHYLSWFDDLGLDITLREEDK